MDVNISLKQLIHWEKYWKFILTIIPENIDGKKIRGMHFSDSNYRYKISYTLISKITKIRIQSFFMVSCTRLTHANILNIISQVNEVNIWFGIKTIINKIRSKDKIQCELENLRILL